MSYPIKEIADVVHLGESNYSQWVADMKAALMMKGCWRIVDKTIPQPSPGSDKLAEWLEKHDMAAGLIWLTLEQSQKAMVQAHQSDAIKLWEELAKLHAKDSEISRFMAYDDLLSITLQENESLSGLISRVEEAVNRVKLLRPTTYTLEKLNAMALC